MEEKDRKRILILYFKSNGELYQQEEEYVVGVFSQKGIIQEGLKKVRYTGHDIIIMDGGDGVRPFVRPFLTKAESKISGFRGFVK